MATYKKKKRKTRKDAFWLNKEIVDKLCEAFSWDGNVVEACFYAGISPAAYYRYREKHEDIVEKWEAHSTKFVLKAKRNIQTQIEIGDLETSQWALQHRSAEYTPKSRTELTGKDGGKLEVELSAEEDSAVSHGLKMLYGNRTKDKPNTPAKPRATANSDTK